MSNNKIETLRQKVKDVESRHSLSTQTSGFERQSEDYFSDAADFESLNIKEDDTPKRIRWSAMELLARREHSVKELINKLIKRYPDNSEDIANCIGVLTRESLQSDERFCEAYVAMRKRKGYGPQRIAAELRERGVCEGLAKEQLKSPDNDWFSVLEIAWQRKFHGRQPMDLKEKAKQIRFLNYRGFYSSDIQELLG